MFNVADWPYDNVLHVGSIVHKLVPAAEKLFPAAKAFNTVPEPATWLSMIMGFAVLGIVMRVRKAGTTSQA
jgi:hypothetical protein